MAAALVAAPVLSGLGLAVTTSAFLVEYLSEGRLPALSVLTAPPRRASLPVPVGSRGIPADLYRAGRAARAPGLVLVHGLAPEGKDEPRLVRAAQLLARLGWAVAVPTVDGLTRLRLRPDDAHAVAGAALALAAAGHAPVAILGVSLGAGPALLAAADPAVAPVVSALLILGGYASAPELLRFTLTGSFAFGEARGHRTPQEEIIHRFARANAELVGEAGQRLVDNRDPARVDALLDALPEDTRRLLQALSPEARLKTVRARLFLVHGRDDPAVPYSETLRLAAAARAAGRPTKAVVVGALAHVEGEPSAGLLDLARLWGALHAFRQAAQAPPG